MVNAERLFFQRRLVDLVSLLRLRSAFAPLSFRFCSAFASPSLRLRSVFAPSSLRLRSADVVCFFMLWSYLFFVEFYGARISIRFVIRQFAFPGQILHFSMWAILFWGIFLPRRISSVDWFYATPRHRQKSRSSIFRFRFAWIAAFLLTAQVKSRFVCFAIF